MRTFFKMSTIALVSMSINSLIAQPNPPNGKAWQKIENLSDEFNTGSLNPSKWSDGATRKFPWVGKEPSVFEPNNTRVEDGRLKIEHTIFPQSKMVNGKLRRYGGGLIRSVNTAEVGTYYEARVKAGHTPFSTAFWVINSRGENTTSGCPRTTELDILETIGRRSREYTSCYGYRTNWVGQMHSNILARETTCPNIHPNNTFKQFTEPLGSNQENWQDFHVYGAWIKSPTEIQFYLDGKPWGGLKTGNDVPAPFDSNKMYIVMSSNLYSWNRGKNANPNNCDVQGDTNELIDPKFIVTRNGTKFFDTNSNETTKAGRDERSAQFDWVRAYKLINDNGSTVTPPNNNQNPNTQKFFIINKQTDKKVRVKSQDSDSNLELVPNFWSGTPTQWTLIPTSSDYFHLQNVSSGMFLRPAADQENSVIIQKPSSYTGNWTQWKKINTANGYFYLQNRQTGDYLRPEAVDDFSKLVQKPTSFRGDWTQYKFENTTNTQGAKDIQTNNLGSGVKLFPSPADTYINIDTEVPAKSVTVYNLQGQVLIEIPMNSTRLKVDVSNLNTAIYMLKIENSDGKSIIRKIVVQ